MSDTIVKELCSSLKLERDRGYQQLVAHLQGLDEEGIYNLQFDLSKILNDIESTWEAKHGALMGAKAVMENGNVSDDFEIEIKRKVMDLLDDNEFRVRIAAGIDIFFFFFISITRINIYHYRHGMCFRASSVFVVSILF
jgi:hypothetical protein